MKAPKLFIDWPDRNQESQLPRGYGVAWENYALRSRTLAIIPFNFLCSWARCWYFRLINGPRDRLALQLIERLSEERAKAYNDGCQDGYQDGYKEGERAGFDRAKLVVEEMIR